MPDFYTYIYFIDGVPEYVGKGKGPRKYKQSKVKPIAKKLAAR